MSEKNIYQKLVEVRKSIDGFTKDAKGYGYDYVSGSQILTKIKSKIDELGIILESHMIAPVVGQSSRGYLVSSPMKMIWVNADKPEDRTAVDWFMAGEQKDPAQALGTGLTYTERYFLLKYFGVPTDEDDPDNPPGKSKNKEQSKNGKVWEIKGKKYTVKDVGDLMLKKHRGDKDKAMADWDIFKDLDKAQQVEAIEKLLEVRV